MGKLTKYMMMMIEKKIDFDSALSISGKQFDFIHKYDFLLFPGHSQIIPAHKYVLATASSVFYAMFYGGLAECKQEIEVPDVEPSAFLTLLK